jgi:hypothetical protein
VEVDRLMGLTRRSTVVGLGSLIAAGGLAVGSGAFSGDSDRSVTVEFADDSNAYLAIGPIESEDREQVTVTQGGDGVVSISVEQVNANARTVLGDLVAFTNNSPRAIAELLVEIDDESRFADLSVTNVPSGISPGETVSGLGLAVDTRDYSGSPELAATIRIRSVLASEEGA